MNDLLIYALYVDCVVFFLDIESGGATEHKLIADKTLADKTLILVIFLDVKLMSNWIIYIYLEILTINMLVSSYCHVLSRQHISALTYFSTDLI